MYLSDVVIGGQFKGTHIQEGGVALEVRSQSAHLLGPRRREHERLAVGLKIDFFALLLVKTSLLNMIIFKYFSSRP